MHAMEQFTIILIMTVPMTRGLLEHLQNCYDYCKLLSNSSYNMRSDCDCTSKNDFNVRLPKQRGFRDDTQPPPEEIEDSEIDYDPVKNNSHHNSPDFVQINKKTEIVNPIPYFKYTDIEPNIFKTKKYNRRNATHDKSRHRSHLENSEQNLHEIITKNEVPLYLDIDLLESTKNKTYYQVLGDIFENFRFIEKNLSTCFNLHIFIFSKNVDSVNKTNTNWGRNVKQYDKLSNSEILTEIQNKCNQTGNLIEQSVYDIKRWLSSKRHSGSSNEANNNSREILNFSNETDASGLKNSDDTKDLGKEDTETNVTMIQLNYGHETSETQLNNATKRNSSNTTINMERLNNPSTEQELAIIPKFNHSQIDSTTETSLDSTIETTTQNTNSDYLLTKHQRNDTLITIPNYLTSDSTFEDTITDAANRAEFQEGEYLIPRVITKELPNNTFESVVDGYEVIPNSDFIQIPTSTTDLSQSVTEQDPEQNIDFGQFTNRTITQDNNSLEIKGHMYFLYGKHQIPARFIQEQHGNIRLAIDAFSLCENYEQQNNKSPFMSLLCHCIVLENCTQN